MSHFLDFRDLTLFHDLLVQIEEMILVTPKQEVERKSEWFCGVKMYLYFCSRFRIQCSNKNLLSQL